MSIRALLILVFGTIIAVLVGMVALSRAIVASGEALERVEEQRYRSYKLADEMRQSSDDLTRMARTYVVTAEQRFRDYFEEVLSIRDGEIGRPERYSGVYWDFVVASGARPTQRGKPAKLLDLMRERQFTEEEFDKLDEAKKKSDALARLETIAMHAVNGRFDDGTGNFAIEGEPNRALAIETMFGDEYHKAKASIMESVNTFLRLVEGRTSREVAEERERSHLYTQFGFFLALGAALGAIAAFFLLHRRVVKPARELAARMHDIAVGEGDLTQRMSMSRNDEFGELSRGFNGFVERIHDLMREVSHASQVVASAAAQISAASAQQEASVGEFGRSTSEIAGAASQISATAQELAGTVRDVNETATRTAEAAGRGRGALQETERVMAGLRTAMTRVTKRLASMDARAKEITEVVTTINRVAEQTNLLSVNAAIESEKAGESGRGFLVVAREIRRLADETEAATYDIAASVRKMQTTVAAGVDEMERFAEQVRAGVGAVTSVSGDLGSVTEEVRALTAQFGSVDEGMAHQQDGARQISASMGTLRDGARQTLESLREFARATTHLQTAVGTLRDQVNQFRIHE